LKITPSAKNPIVNAVSPSRGQGASAASASPAGKNTVELSPAARQLANLQNSSNDIDIERIQQIKDAIAAGELKINPGRIADSLLVSVRELLK